MFAGSAEAKSQLNLTLSSSNIIQDANFIDFKYCFLRAGAGENRKVDSTCQIRLCIQRPV